RIARDEIAAESSINVIAETSARRLFDDGLADEAEVPGHGKTDIREAELDELAVACEAAVALGGEYRSRGEKAGHGVPRRQHVVHRTVVSVGARYERKAERRVDRVVDRRCAVAVACDQKHDQVVAQLLELRVRAPAGRRQVGEKDAGAVAGS